MDRKFTLGAILTIVGDKLMCEIGQVYEILNYMTGDNLFTHQLPRAARECRPVLLGQYPYLSEWQSAQERVTGENYKQVLSEYEKKWGKELAVIELSAVEKHEYKEPIQEAAEMVGPEKIIVVTTPDAPPQEPKP